MFVRKFVSVMLLSSLGLGVSMSQTQSLTVAATPVPHAELLEFVKPELARQGVVLDIKVFTDYVQPNRQVSDGAIDANFFQHKPYMDSFNQQHGTKLVSIGLVHVEPFGAYSSKVKSLGELKDGAQVALPNDPSNGARALLLLQKAGLISLKDPTDILATSRDIVDNPKKLRFREIEAANLPRVLPDVDLALINTNYALEAGLNPSVDALVIEGVESPYANLVAVVQGNEDSEVVKKLIQALQSDATRQFIKDQYKGTIVPAF